MEIALVATDAGTLAHLMGFGHRVYKNHDPRATGTNNRCSCRFGAVTLLTSLLEGGSVTATRHRPAAVLSRADGAAWWRDAVIYQVYPRSFADADGDGVGDLPGITSRLDHLVELGVDAVWLSPFYVSPQADAGYDVADYRDVDPLFGTPGRRRHADRGRRTSAACKVIVDLVPNHTSDRAPLVPGGAGGRAGLARAGPLPVPGRARRRRAAAEQLAERLRRPGLDPGRRTAQWYLHLFDTGQPDLNWDHPRSGTSSTSVIAVLARPRRRRLPDRRRPRPGQGARPARRRHRETPWGAPDSGPMWDQDGVHDIYRRWRSIADAYPGERILVAEAWVSPLERLARYVRPDELHQAFNFEYLLAPWRAADQRAVITASLAAAGSVGAPTTWVLSNHDVVRHATRLGYPAGAPRCRSASDADDPAPDDRRSDCAGPARPPC